MKHIVALSGGKDSTALAIQLAETEPREYEYICTPTENELPEMLAHWLNLGRLLGKPIQPIPTISLKQLVYKQKALPNWRMRWCTRMIKIEPFEDYILANRPCTVYVGIRADEADREGVEFESLSGESLSELVIRRYPLVEWGWNKADVLGFLASRQVIIPERTDCAFCFFQRLHEWYLLWLNHRSIWMEGEEWERFTGHTFRSPQRDSWPAALCDMRARFEAGVIPKQTKDKERKIQARVKPCRICRGSSSRFQCHGFSTASPESAINTATSGLTTIRAQPDGDTIEAMIEEGISL